MKKLLLVVLLGSALSVCGWSQSVTNPGFESDLAGWTTFTWGDAQSPVISVITESPHSGAKCLKIDASRADPEDPDVVGGVYQRITGIAAGEDYIVSLWTKGENLTFGFDGEGRNDPGMVWWWRGIDGSADWQYTDNITQFDTESGQVSIFLMMENRLGYWDDIEIRIASAIEGVVKDQDTGLPIQGVTVSTTAGGYSTTTDAAGKYKLRFMTPGTYTVQYRDYRYNDLDVADVIVVRGAKTTQNVNMTAKPTGTLTGTVYGTKPPAGPAPLVGAKVSFDTIPLEATTGTGGVYTIAGVPIGNYTVTAKATGYVPSTQPVTINASQTTTRNFSLTWRVVNPTNALTNGDFEAGMTGWEKWRSTHFSEHGCGYTTQWHGIGSYAEVITGAGVGGSNGMVMGYDGDGWGSLGGVCQTCNVEPGKYYRVRAQFKGAPTPDVSSFSAGLYLVDGRFNPGEYTDPWNPPAPPYYPDDVFLVACGQENAEYMVARIAEPNRWWHNIMSMRTSSEYGRGGWDWDSSLNYSAPRNWLAQGIKKATGDQMTVVLYESVLNWESWGDMFTFDNVVLEEVPAPAPVTDLGLLSKCNISPPYSLYPEIHPMLPVNISGEVVTGVFTDYASGYPMCTIEELDRRAGIRVDLPPLTNVQIGDKVSFTGSLVIGTEKSYGVEVYTERKIIVDAGSFSVLSHGNPIPKPITLSLKHLSAKLGSVNPCYHKFAPLNTGLLATVFGRVFMAQDNGSSGIWVWIDDGSNASPEVYVAGAPEVPAEGAYVTATGVIGVSLETTIYPVMVIRIRPDTIDDDFTVIRLP